MKKSTKGALAAGAAVILLTGGASTLAYWNATTTVAGGAVSTGTLTMAGSTCSSVDWQLDGTPLSALAGRLLVPGDTITKSCAVTVTATGAHNKGTISAIAAPTATVAGLNGASAANAASFPVTVGMRTGTNPFATTALNFPTGTTTVDVQLTMAVADPVGAADNTTKDQSVTVPSLTLTAVQAH